MEVEPLKIDFRDVKREDKARIKSAIEETARLTDQYLKNKRPLNPALVTAAKRMNLPEDVLRVQAGGLVYGNWVGIDEKLGTETVRETLQNALKLNPQKTLTGVEYRGCEWVLYNPDDLLKISVEDRVVLTHKDVTNVYVACGGRLKSSTK